MGLYSSEYRFLFFVKVSIFIDKTILHQEIKVTDITVTIYIFPTFKGQKL